MGRSPQERLDSALRHCEKHWEEALKGDRMHVIGYDIATRQVLRELRSMGSPSQWAGFVSPGDKSAIGPLELSLAGVDSVAPAVSSRPSPDNQGIMGAALGVPIIAKTEYRKEAAVPAKLFPLHGRSLPGTVVIDFSTAHRPKFRVFDPLRTREPLLAGAPRKLAVDLHTPLKNALANGFFGEFFSLPRLFQPQRGMDEVGIYSLTPYRKGAIPVVFIHGLESDPSTWLEAMHAVWSDPELAKRYQVWYFMYPTGLPIPESAARLRRSLEMARNIYDPKKQDPALSKTVLVGHSMGGVLAHWQVVAPGKELWKAFFPGTPPERLPMGVTEREALKKHLIFEPSKSISRAIFVATPHRGSGTASRVGDIIVRFIKLPFDLAGVALSLASLDAQFLNPQLREYKHMGQTSLETLRPDYPAGVVLNKLPIRVPHHSIIAKLQPKLALLESSDGAVPYMSSHLETAQSEKIIGAWHSCCKQPETVAEIKRILSRN